MTALPQLQGEFQDFLLDRSTGFAARVKRTTRADEASLLNIYRNAYGARLAEVLGNDYPALKAVMGEPGFDAMARAYIARHPSRHPSARWVGGGLEAFLRMAVPWADDPALAEMAAFEWAMAGAFDAADMEALTFEKLTAIPGEAWPGLRFRFGPSLRRLSLGLDMPAVWLAVNERRDGALKAGERKAEWLIWRAGLEVRFRALGADEARALDRAASGADFASLCEDLCQWVEAGRAAFRAAELVRGWVDSSLVEDAWAESPTLA